jgi:hypothetical protein
MSDAFSSIKYYSSPIAAAAWASDLTPKEMEQTADSLFILRKHRELSNLPVNEARKTFEKLDDSLQSEIKQVLLVIQNMYLLKTHLGFLMLSTQLKM